MLFHIIEMVIERQEDEKQRKGQYEDDVGFITTEKRIILCCVCMYVCE